MVAVLKNGAAGAKDRPRSAPRAMIGAPVLPHPTPGTDPLGERITPPLEVPTTMTRSFETTTLRLIGPALALLAMAAPAFAQDDLPTAEEVMNKYIEATGGAGAYEKLSSRKITGTVEIVAAGVKGDLTIYQQAPDKLLSTLDFEGIGEVVQGTDGEVAWAEDPNTGDRVLEGAEKADFLRESTFNSELKWKELYKTVEVTGKEDVDGTSCYVVVMTPEEGQPETTYLAVDSGLMVKTKTVQTSPLGDQPVEVSVSDYREVDGVKIPFTSTIRVLQQEIKMSFENVEHNVEIPEGTFDVPESVKL